MKLNTSLLKELDNIIEHICDDLLIADHNGEILKASATFDDTYEMLSSNMVGKSVYELERQGYFNPSITRLVIESGKKMTLKQRNKIGRDIIVTGIPIMDEKDELMFVVSFTRDITDFIVLQDQYKSLEVEMMQYKKELEFLRNEQLEVEGVIAESPKMKQIFLMINKIAGFDANVLLTGNSGVGKSMLAKFIHNKSSRMNGPFIEINCGAIPESLLKSELFGYERGSFTGANKEGKAGLIELAQNGTLFLDEISEMPLSLQVKVLRVIQEKKIMRVGGNQEIFVDFRLITASNRKLEDQVKAGLFREDLYYRLKVIPIHIPPLKDRKEDIVPMCMYFITKFNDLYGLNKKISYVVMEMFQKYDWPGNIRELENLIERMVLTSESDTIDLECLPLSMKDAGCDYSQITTSGMLTAALENLERKMVQDAYKKCGTTVGVAKILGISQPTATRKIKKHIKEREKDPMHLFVNEYVFNR